MKSKSAGGSPVYRLTAAATLTMAISAGIAPSSAAPLAIKYLGGIEPLALALPTGINVHTEMPPVLLPGPQNSRLIYLPTSFVYLCQTSGNPLVQSVQLSANQCEVVDLPEDSSAPKVYIAPGPGGTLLGKNQWKLNYDGIFSAHITHDTIGRKDIILTINHSETKNFRSVSGYNYQSPFAPTAASLPADCGYQGYMGAGPRGFQNCWRSYAGFVSVEKNDYSAATNFGRTLNQSLSGPVVWPTNGYYDLSKGLDGQLSVGLRHPSSIISGGYLYIFYLDSSKGRIGGLATMGTKLARAHLSARGLPESFYAWNGTDFNTPALPAGFDKNNMSAYLSKPGPQNSSLFAGEAAGNPGYPLQSTHFSVAYSAARNMFVGVEDFKEYSSGLQSSKIALRTSPDLIHWSSRNVLPFDGKDLSYATFANANFTSNSEVDFRNLYIIGTNRGQVNVLHLSIE